MATEQDPPNPPPDPAEPPGPRRRGTPRWQKAFLEALAQSGNVLRAARIAGVARGTPHRQRTLYPDFARLWAEASEEAADRLEDEARRRAVEGLRRYKFTKSGEPVYHPDDCECGHARRGHEARGAGPCQEPGCTCQSFEGVPYCEHAYSDPLLTLLLKAERPEKFARLDAPPSPEEVNDAIRRLLEKRRLGGVAPGGAGADAGPTPGGGVADGGP